MSDLPYNNNLDDKCLYCSHTYALHSSYNHKEDIEGKNVLHDNPKVCSFVNHIDGSACQCPGFRSATSITEQQLNSNIRNYKR